MEFLEIIKGRRSIRAFTKQHVSENVIEKLVDAARWAPSAGNIQPWEFVVVRAKQAKNALAQAALNQVHVEEAPVVIVVCADEQRSQARYGVRGKTLYCLQDTAAATQNILLAAYSLGLGTCWVGAFNEIAVKQALEIPEHIRPIAIIPVGYSNETPTQNSRRPLNQIVHRDHFR